MIVILFSPSFSVIAQSNYTYQINFLDTLFSGYELNETPSGDLIIGGEYGFTNQTIQEDLLLTRISANGTIIWSKKYSSGGWDLLYESEIKSSAKGSYIVGTSGGVVGAINNSPDILVYHIDNSGNLIWAKRLGQTQSDRGYSVHIKGNGNVIVMGLITYNWVSDGQCVIAELDTNGNLLWDKVYSNTDGSAIIPKRMIASRDGGYFIAGYFAENPPFTRSGALIKIDSIGDISWAKKYDKENLGIIYDIVELNDRNIVLLGKSYYEFTTLDSIDSPTSLMKIDKNGTILISKYLNYSSKNEQGLELITNKDNSITALLSVKDSTYNTPLIIKLDEYLNPIYANLYNSNSVHPQDISVCSRGGYYISTGITPYDVGEVNLTNLIKVKSTGEGGCSKLSVSVNLIEAQISEDYNNISSESNTIQIMDAEIFVTPLEIAHSINCLDSCSVPSIDSILGSINVCPNTNSLYSVSEQADNYCWILNDSLLSYSTNAYQQVSIELDTLKLDVIASNSCGISNTNSKLIFPQVLNPVISKLDNNCATSEVGYAGYLGDDFKNLRWQINPVLNKFEDNPRVLISL
ncbi:MAG: hypothetical protein JKY53_03665 [Flavobacteriales bacterium]|nr:hypothetical protein [Flavobacteriales bacterium]